jgi:hypothetical protein
MPSNRHALQAAATGLVDAMEGGKAGQAAKGARDPASDQISALTGLSNGSPQEWKAEQAKTAGGGGEFQPVVSAPPDPLTDQGSQTGHEGFRADAAAADLGQSCAEDGSAVVPWWGMVWIPQIGERLRQFRQQCVVTGAMELAEHQADPTADRDRPNQRNLPVQSFHDRIPPELSGDQSDQCHEQSYPCSTDGSSEQSQRAETKLSHQ